MPKDTKPRKDPARAGKLKEALASDGAVRKKEVLVYRGLCLTCATNKTCVFPRDPGRPVIFCDEFCEEEAPAKPDPAETLPAKSTVAADMSNSGKFRGLCKTCVERETCQFPKLAGGVWHCEEYK